MTYNRSIRLASALMVVISLFTACKKDDHIESCAPAVKIQRSEKLLIPEIVAVPEDEAKGTTRVATFYAEGVQKYKAQQKAGSAPAEYEWIFVAPQADLFDINNRKVGTHGAGPYWEISPADSIFGQAYVPARSAAATQINSIDWLLLMPKAGKVPTGLFSKVSYIQRIATEGGKAPAASPKNASETIDVKYKAVYRFTRKNN